MSLRINTENVLSLPGVVPTDATNLYTKRAEVVYGPLPEKFKGVANWQGAWKHPASPMLAFRDGENTSAAKEPKGPTNSSASDARTKWNVSIEVKGFGKIGGVKAEGSYERNPCPCKDKP